MDLLNTGVPLGRFFGIRVVMHFWFILYAIWEVARAKDLAFAAVDIVVLFGIVLLHEFGHCFACRAVRGRADHILLWPLGGLAFVEPPPKPWAQLITTVGGPLVNVVLIPLCWVGLAYVLPRLPEESLAAHWFAVVMLLGLYINGMLLVFNLLPLYPFDGGRILQEVLWFVLGYPRSLLVAAMVGTVGGLALIGLGLGLTTIHIPVPAWYTNVTGTESMPLGADLAHNGPDWLLIAIGVMGAMASWGSYQQAQQLLAWRKK